MDIKSMLMTTSSIVNGYCIASAPIDATFTSNSSEPTGTAWSIDGSKLFYVSTWNPGDRVAEVNCPKPYTIESASHTGNYYATLSQGSYPQSISFNATHTKMFISFTDTKIIAQYSLATPDVISTGVTYDGSFSTASQGTGEHHGLVFSPDGTKMMTTSTGGHDLFEYTLATPFIVTSGVTYNRMYNFANTDYPSGVAFNDDGLELFVSLQVSSTVPMIRKYTVTTPYTLLGIADSGISVPTTDNPQDVMFNDDGTKMFVTLANNKYIRQYTTKC